MPLAPIDDKGTSIYYEDSGVPAGTPNYTTIVIVHGLIINGATFRRLFPFALQQGLRIITMNMRDYRGSTPYSPEELAHMTSPDIEVQTSAVRRFGQEIAKFILYVCETKDIPEIAIDGERKSGDPETLGEGKLKSTMARYYRKAILYDPPSIIYGIYPEIGLFFPLRDPRIPPEQAADAFIEWCSSYYKSLPSGVPITAETLQGCTVITDKTPTLLGLPTEEKERMLDRSVLFASGLIMGTAMEIRQRNARRALLDADAVLPAVDVVAIWADLSVFLCLWGVKVLSELLEEEPAEGKRKRQVSILKLENTNHFYHWDEPEKMVRLLNDIMAS